MNRRCSCRNIRWKLTYQCQNYKIFHSSKNKKKSLYQNLFLQVKLCGHSSWEFRFCLCLIFRTRGWIIRKNKTIKTEPKLLKSSSKVWWTLDPWYLTLCHTKGHRPFSLLVIHSKPWYNLEKKINLFCNFYMCSESLKWTGGFCYMLEHSLVKSCQCTITASYYTVKYPSRVKGFLHSLLIISNSKKNVVQESYCITNCNIRMLKFWCHKEQT